MSEEILDWKIESSSMNCEHMTMRGDRPGPDYCYYHEDSQDCTFDNCPIKIKEKKCQQKD